MAPSSSVPIVGLLLPLLFGLPAAGQGLVTNGGFDTDISGWFHTPESLESSIAWDPMDVDGLSTSGSARVELDPAASGNAFSMNQCIEVSDEVLYDVGAWVFLPSSAPLDDSFVRIQWFDAPDCDGSLIGGTDIATFEVADEWLDVSDVDVAPLVGAQSARFYLTLLEDGSISLNRVAYWDDVHFVPEPSGSVVPGALFLAAVARRKRG